MNEPGARPKVLFLCTGNSCRSQMAEGFARALKGEEIEARSAGIEPKALDPHAVKVMAEAGVDISGHYSKRADELRGVEFDLVVTVCDAARERCPFLPGAKRVVHRSFDDPPALARDARTEEEALDHYRRVRDEIRAFVESMPEALEREGSMACCDGPKAAPGCCGGSDDTRSKVREGYARIASGGGSCCGPASCCGAATSADDVARAVGYSEEDLAALPEGSNMGLSCGNPTALASLAAGEVVLDLGSGGGLDCFIAARKVGPEGRAIGVDMTPEMVSKARANAEAFRRETGLGNVEFRLGEIEHLPVADASVDVVVSNCVINLSPEKPQVWREIARVLKPGGRVSVSDLALLRPLPDAVRSSVEALVGCVAGAVLVEETRRMVDEAGLVDAELATDSRYVDEMADWSDPLYREIAAKLPQGSKPGDFVTSLKLTARKPG